MRLMMIMTLIIVTTWKHDKILSEDVDVSVVSLLSFKLGNQQRVYDVSRKYPDPFTVSHFLCCSFIFIVLINLEH